MASGTGLPIPKSGNVVQGPGLIDADRYSSARAWSNIAAAGAKIASDAGNLLAREQHEQQARATADFELSHSDFYTKLRDQYANDPGGYEKAARAHNDEALQQVPGWMLGHAKTYLNGKMQSGMSATLSEKRSSDQALANESLDARRKMADNDVMTLAAAGKIDEAAIKTYASVVDAAVTSNLMASDKATLLKNDLAARAQGEVVAREAAEIYRSQGYEAAVNHLTSNIRDNDKLTLSPADRQRVFNRGLSAVKLAQNEDKADRGAAIEIGRDLLTRYNSNQPVDPGEFRDVLAELKRTGAAAMHQRLLVAAQTAEQLAPYRSGAMSVTQLGDQVARARGEARPGLLYTITSAAHARNVDPSFLIETARRESSFNPNAQATTSSAGGLFQFTDQTWLSQFQKDGAAAGQGALASKITFDGKRFTVADPEARAQIMALKKDDAVASALAAGLTADNRSTLAAGLGRDPNAGELYVAHFAGAQGALKLLKSDPNAVAADLMPAAAAANPKIFYSADGTPLTAGAVTARLASTFGKDDAGAPFPSLSETTKNVQSEYVKQTRAAWPAWKQLIDQGRPPSAEDLAAVRYAAKLSGDGNWMREVETKIAEAVLGQEAAGKSEAEKSALLDRMFVQFRNAGWTPDTQGVFNNLQKQFNAQSQHVREDPVEFAVRYGNIAPPKPLDFSSPDAAVSGVAERVAIARRVAEQQEVPVGNPLRTEDRTRLAATIAAGQPQQAFAAMRALASLPDDMLTPAIAGEVKDAMVGATRSVDPARVNAAMSTMDRLYNRAPGSFVLMFGEEAWNRLKTWQTNQRYMTPEAAAEELRRAEDPQVRARREANESEGRKLARKLDPDDVVKAFDQSFGVTPAFIARATGSLPVKPADVGTRDALMGDYENVFARRYAETLDADKAKEQAIEMLRTKWARSGLNGGQLMLRAPETTYPMIGGSHDWMAKQLEESLTNKLGPRYAADEPTATGENWSYQIVSDRQTEADAQAGKPPSYQVVVTNKQTGKTDVLRNDMGQPDRYRWNAGPAQGQAEAEFMQQRARVLPWLQDPYAGVAFGGP